MKREKVSTHSILLKTPVQVAHANAFIGNLPLDPIILGYGKLP